MKRWGLAAVLLSLVAAGWIALDERKARQTQRRVREYHDWQKNGGPITPPPFAKPRSSWWDR